jgi:hypothetical protein
VNEVPSDEYLFNFLMIHSLNENERFARAYRRLSPRMMAAYSFKDAKTFRELGNSLGLTASRARELLHWAGRRLGIFYSGKIGSASTNYLLNKYLKPNQISIEVQKVINSKDFIKVMQIQEGSYLYE